MTPALLVVRGEEATPNPPKSQTRLASQEAERWVPVNQETSTPTKERVGEKIKLHSLGFSTAQPWDLVKYSPISLRVVLNLEYKEKKKK